LPWARPCEYSKPWWTLECQEAVRLTRYIRNFYIRTQSQEAWEEYLRCKNLKGKVIARAKTAGFRRHVEKASQTQAGLWRTAQWAAQRAKGLKQVVSIPTLTRDVHKAHTSREKAEMLKQAHFPPPVEADLRYLEGYSYPERVSIPERLVEDEGLKVIKELANDKAPGPDGIPNRILKRVAGVAPALLTRIFQACID
jgi:hypothetical protein